MRARRTAWDALRAVHQRDAYANLVLPSLLRARGLTGAEAARATDLTYGTLRGLGTYDRIIDACTSRPLAAVDDDLLDALRLGTHQLLGGRVPAHAAVATTVDLVRDQSGPRAGGFVNAVLRHVADADLDGWADRLAPRSTDDREHLAFRLLHPRWVVDAISDALQEMDDKPGTRGSGAPQTHRDRLAAVLTADNSPAKVTLAAIPGRSTVSELVACGACAGRLTRTAATLPAGDPAEVPAVAAGRARVQDEGSQLVAALLADAEVAGDDSAWADLCAGPGGKALLLGGWASERDARVVAAERHWHRAVLTHRAARQAGLPAVGVIQADSRVPPWPNACFSRVLLDAPCTGLGALRRRPEARWRRRPDDLGRLVPLQTALLHSAVDSTRPGGVVGYVTCSPHPAETVGVVDAVLAGRGDVHVEHAPGLAPSVPDAARGPYLQLWPDRHGTDAMFLALLRRTT